MQEKQPVQRLAPDPALTPVEDVVRVDDQVLHADHHSSTNDGSINNGSTDLPSEEKGQPPVDLVEKYVSSKARGIKARIRRFTPSWYSVVMGVGICNTLLFDLPWASTHDAFRGIGAGFLAVDILICILFTILTAFRFIYWPEILPVLLGHETHSLFLGTIPMGYVTIISGIGFTGASYSIPNTVYVGAGLFWLAFAMALIVATVVPFSQFTKHNVSAEGLSALWLLPIVPPITIAASGSVFANLLTPTDPHYALAILLTSYTMNGIGLLIAFMILTAYIQRLAIYHLPPREIIVSTMLPLGPCGQGGYALIRLGAVARELFPLLAQLYPDRPAYVALAAVGAPMHGAGIVLGLLFWGLGIWFAFISLASIGSVFTQSMTLGQFTMGMWSSTFPIGSLALLTLALGDTFDSLFFNVVGTIMTVIVISMTLLCGVQTVKGFVQGTLFSAPCLTRLPETPADTPSRGRSKTRLARP